MSLTADLEKLQRRKRDEIRTLHQTYLRTKRTLIRNASPARVIRRNMGISMVAAAIFGMLLAPRGSASPAPMNGDAASAKSGVLHSLSGFKKLIGRFFPKAASYIPDADTAPSPPPAPPEHKAPDDQPAPASDESPKKRPSQMRAVLGLVMKELAAMALSKLDFQKLMADAMTRFTHRATAPDDGEPQEHPHMSVANAGTVEPNDYNDFT